VACVIYDLDELMVNSTALHILLWEEMLEPHGLTNAQTIKSSHIGMRTKDIMQDVGAGLGWDIEEKHARYMARLTALARERIEPMPGLLASVARLRDAKIPLAIGTSSVRAYVDAILERLSLQGMFDAIVTGEDVSRGKPNPEVYLRACELLGAPPSRCVVLEDAASGVLAAKRAGCRCIAVPNPHTPPQDLQDADLIVHSLEGVTPQVVRRLAGEGA
jgi:HAD superfamily hydrolase (TIGR01509 family)